jgi:hypothetical protein
MGRVHDRINPKLRDFIERQHLFFVATAALSADGHVNVSPKGIPGTSCVVDDHRFAYLDITASGAETIAHLRENGRIVVMFCAFEGPPNVLRLHGRGRVVGLHDPGYAEWAARFDAVPGARAVIVVDVERVSDSCGWGVPLFDHAGERDLLPAYMDGKGVEGRARYRREKNRVSTDGLPAFDDDGPDDGSSVLADLGHGLHEAGQGSRANGASLESAGRRPPREPGAPG